MLLMLFTAIFISGVAPLLKAFWNSGSFNARVVTSGFAAFLVLWYMALISIMAWSAFGGTEEITVEHKQLNWTRKLLWWEEKLVAPAEEVSAVRASGNWFQRDERVEFTYKGRRYKIGKMLLHSEALELADALRKALQLPRSAE